MGDPRNPSALKRLSRTLRSPRTGLGHRIRAARGYRRRRRRPHLPKPAQRGPSNDRVVVVALLAAIAHRAAGVALVEAVTVTFD
jgi:hypothetical protein